MFSFVFSELTSVSLILSMATTSSLDGFCQYFFHFIDSKFHCHNNLMIHLHLRCYRCFVSVDGTTIWLKTSLCSIQLHLDFAFSHS